MPAAEQGKGVSKDASQTSESNTQYAPAKQSIFTIPTPVKRLFDKFPLVTYSSNELPLRTPRDRHKHKLYIWALSNGLPDGQSLSFNPSCLKWQTYFKMCGLELDTVPSTNHASPSGALPFLIPGLTKQGESTDAKSPISSSDLQSWARTNCSNVPEESSDVRYEAYLSLVEHTIRRAWLYSLYLTPNFDALILPSYVPTSYTSSTLIRLATAYQLQSAARAELEKHSPILLAAELYNEARRAFGALDTLLATSSTGWFFGSRNASLFDAAVFGYSHLLLDEDWVQSSGAKTMEERGPAWQDDALRSCLVDGCTNLRLHRDRVFAEFYGLK